MGIGAALGIAGSIAGLASAGVGIAGDLGAFGGGSGGSGGSGAYGNQLKILANNILNSYQKPGYWNIDPTQLLATSMQAGMQYAPQINQFNMQQLQGLLGQALPGYQQAVGTSMGNINAMLQGQVPTDVQQMLTNSSAYQALQTGMGAGGAATGTAAAGINTRALGLTSLGLQQQGQAGLQSMIQLGRTYLTPQLASVQSILPLSTLLQESEWAKSNQYNAALAYYTGRANSLAAQFGGQPANNLAGLASNIGGAAGTLFGTPGGTNQGLIGQIAGMYTGGGTSGLGGITDITGTGIYGGGASGDPFGLGGSLAF